MERTFRKVSLLLSILVLFFSNVNANSDQNPQNAIVFLFFSLVVGALVTYLLSRYLPDLPYTLVVFILGAIFAVIITQAPSQNALQQSLQLWNRIDPNLLLFMFLPALLFSDAMNLNYHHVKGALPSTLLLAGPGALFCAFAIAFAMKYITPYNWSWKLSLLFGSIVCPTDAVGKNSHFSS